MGDRVWVVTFDDIPETPWGTGVWVVTFDDIPKTPWGTGVWVRISEVVPRIYFCFQKKESLHTQFFGFSWSDGGNRLISIEPVVSQVHNYSLM